MDKIARTILEVASLLRLAILLFPPFQLANGQSGWGFIGLHPTVSHWGTWDDFLANNFKTAKIRWGFPVMEVAAIAVIAISV